MEEHAVLNTHSHLGRTLAVPSEYHNTEKKAISGDHALAFQRCLSARDGRLPGRFESEVKDTLQFSA